VLVGPADAHDVVADAFLAAAPTVLGGTVENPGGYGLAKRRSSVIQLAAPT